MSRPIKFRAWDGQRFVYWSMGHDHSSFIEAIGIDQNRQPAQEYTGLKDKNGKEIYEGDIFEFTEAKKRRKGQVVFEDAMFKMKDASGWGATTLQNQYDMQVIGNIYENPELLRN